VQMQYAVDDADGVILLRSSDTLVSRCQPTSDSQPSLSLDSLAAASSSSDTQHLASVRHMADTFARAVMSTSSTAEAARVVYPSLQWSDELAMATLTGMRAIAEMMDVDFFVTGAEDTEPNADTLACIRRRLQHILSLPAQP